MPEPASLTAGTRRRRWLTVLLMVLGALLPDVPVALAAGGSGWTTQPSLTAPRAAMATANGPCPRGGQGGTCIYVIGGSGVSDITGTVEAYNPAVGFWTEAAPLREPRTGLAATAAPCPPGEAGTCIYAIGGLKSDGTPSSTVEVYDPALNRWTRVAPLPEPQQNLAAATGPCPPGDGSTCVYAMGGFGTDISNLVAEVHAYNPASNAWTETASLPVPRAYLAGAAAPCPPGQSGTCLYTYGGQVKGGPEQLTNLSTVESFNPATDHWTEVSSMLEPRAVLSGAAGPCPPGQSGTCLYAFGGQTMYPNGHFGPILDTVRSYNPITDAWTSLPRMTMPTPLVGLGTSFAPCPASEEGTCAYIIGGERAGADLPPLDTVLAFTTKA